MSLGFGKTNAAWHRKAKWLLAGLQSKHPTEVGPPCTEQLAFAEAKACQLPPPAAEEPSRLQLLVPLPQLQRLQMRRRRRAIKPRLPPCSRRQGSMLAVAEVQCPPRATCARAVSTWNRPGQGTPDTGKRLEQQGGVPKLRTASVPPIPPAPAVFGWIVWVCSSTKFCNVRRMGGARATLGDESALFLPMG